MEIKEITDFNELMGVYDIYKQCMYMPTKDKYKAKIISYLSDDCIKIYGCLDKEIIVGVIVVKFHEYSAEILGIAVDVSVRNQGIGSYMVNTVKNIYVLNFIIAETDSEAVGFYRKLGFTISEFIEVKDNTSILRYRCER